EPITSIFSAQVAEATAPTLNSASGSYNADNRQMGLRYEGTDPENDVTALLIDLLDADGGSLLAEPAQIELGPQPNPEALIQGGGMFRGELFVSLEGFPPVSGVRLTVVDVFDRRSDPVDIVPAVPDPVLELGGLCNLAGVFDTCTDGFACVDSDDRGPTLPECVSASPPTVTEGALYLNADAGVIGIVITGRDVNDNAIGVSVLPKDDEGADLSLLADGGPETARFSYVSNADGTYTGWTAVSFRDACFPAAQFALNDCVFLGGAQDVCLDQANAGFDACAAQRAGRVRSADVAGIDDTDKTSEIFTINMVQPTPIAEAGASCDAAAAVAICSEGDLCFGRANPGTHLTCAAPQLACFDDVPTAEVSMDEMPPWVLMGTNADVENYVGVSSCGGGGPQAIYTFTAPAAGVYAATTSDIETDTLIFVRSHCQLPGEAYELACNDDIEIGVRASTVEFDVEADQTVYIVVDSFVNEGIPSPGAFTLTIEPR
ncbi:MAG: hypothetical protein ACI9U2_004580, partial [Bradymonadia bacterium]